VNEIVFIGFWTIE